MITGTSTLLPISVFLFLGLLYLLMHFYRKNRRRLNHRYLPYYEQVEKLLSAYKLVGKPVADLFGRETVVSNHEGDKALCLILPPPMINAWISQRFGEYTRLIEGMQLSLLAPYYWIFTADAWVIIQQKLLHADGRKLLTFDKCIKDGRLSAADVQEVLVRIAKCLSNLHRSQTDCGEALYHGFLLPRSIFINADGPGGVKEVLVAYHGLVSSIGKEKFQKYLQDLKKGNLVIDKWISNELLAQIKLLAPEQQTEEKMNNVGPSSDYFTFASLALMAFSGGRFRDQKTFDWSCVPENWHSFLTSCLSEDVEARPKDFGCILN